MYFFITIIKLFLVKWRRLFFSAASILLFSGIIGLTGNMMLYNSKIIEPFSIAIVDNDKSFETKVLITTIKSLEYIKNIVTIKEINEEEASSLLDKNDIAAYVVFPMDFAKDIRTGINPPINVIRNETNHLRSLIIEIFIESGIDYLASMQSGVYAFYDYSHEKIEKNIFDKLLLDVNLEFISIILSREDIFTHTTVSATGNVSIFEYYLIAALVFFAFINSTLFTDILQIFLNNNMSQKLKLTNTKTSKIIISITLSCFCYTLILNTIIIFTLFYLLNIKIILNIYNIIGMIGLFLCLATYQTAIAVLFKDSRQAGICNFIICVASLFLSGGIIPLSFLPTQVSSIGMWTLNYEANNLLKNFISFNINKFSINLYLTALILLIISITTHKLQNKSLRKHLLSTT